MVILLDPTPALQLAQSLYSTPGTIGLCTKTFAEAFACQLNEAESKFAHACGQHLTPQKLLEYRQSIVSAL